LLAIGTSAAIAQAYVRDGDDRTGASPTTTATTPSPSPTPSPGPTLSFDQMVDLDFYYNMTAEYCDQADLLADQSAEWNQTPEYDRGDDAWIKEGGRLQVQTILLQSHRDIIKEQVGRFVRWFDRTPDAVYDKNGVSKPYAEILMDFETRLSDCGEGIVARTISRALDGSGQADDGTNSNPNSNPFAP
jgi:hypothetical protein